MRIPWWSLGAILGGIAVAMGAFGAHGLRDQVDERMLAAFKTGARYHMYHALALLLVDVQLWRAPESGAQRAGWAFLLGIVLFSGSLYAMAITGNRSLGAVTPFGGLTFMIGWALLAWSGRPGQSPKN